MMDIRQKFQAINALASASIKIDVEGNFFVSHGVYIRTAPGAPATICVVGRGALPADAIEAHWKLLTAAKIDNPLCVDGAGEKRAYIWNGFMWEQVKS